MAIQTKRMNWMRLPTAWESAQSWRGKRSAMRAQFESASSAASSGFTSAHTNQTSGLANLAAQQAVARLKAEQQAKIKAALASLDLSA